MFEIEFYENAKGESELWDFLESLREQAETNKDSRIQYKQIIFYIELLKNSGTRLSENITKHLDDGIWELRPGSNRVFISFIVITDLCCCTISERKPKRLRNEKSKKPKPKGPIICHERSAEYENVGRL